MTHNCPGCAAPAAATTAQGDLIVCGRCQGRFVVPGATALSLRTSHGVDGEQVVAELELPDEFRARYELGQVAGSGAMGLVVFAHDRVTDEPVAIKFLSRMNSPEALDRFVREARALQRVRSPFVVEVRGLDVLGPHPYLVLERVDGGTLRERLRRERKLQAADAGRVAIQVAQGLSAFHARGIVHRDLKPENLLFDASGSIKVADLGIAMDYSDIGQTLPGAVIGTPLYMSPEQVRGERPGTFSDLYSLGVVLHEMLAGRPPFAGLMKEVFHAHLNTEPPDLARAAPDTPPGLIAVVRRLLAKRPSERPQTAEDVVLAIGRALAIPGATGAGATRKMKALEVRSLLTPNPSSAADRPAAGPANPPSTPAAARPAAPPVNPPSAGARQAAPADPLPAAVAAASAGAAGVGGAVAPARMHPRFYWECRIGGQRAPVRLAGNALVFGRGFEADVRIVNETVSASHALLVVDADALTLTDLRSSAGTLVNGRGVLVAELADGDRVQFGSATMTVHRCQELLPGPAPEVGSARVDEPEKWLGELARVFATDGERGLLWEALDAVMGHFPVIAVQMILIGPQDFRVIAWAPHDKPERAGSAADQLVARTAATLGATTVSGDRLATPLICRGKPRGALVVQLGAGGLAYGEPAAWPLWQAIAAALVLAHDAHESNPTLGSQIFEVPTY